MNAVPDDRTTEAQRPSGTRDGRTDPGGGPADRLEPDPDAITAVFFDGSPPSYGGGSEMVYRLLTRLDEDAFQPLLLAHSDDELCERLRGEVPVDVVPFRGSLDQYDGELLRQPRFRAIGTAGRLLQFNVEARSTLRGADVVWCMNLRSVLTIAPFALASSTPIVWNIGLGQPSEGVYRYLNGLALRVADRVFVESEHQARELFTERQYRRHADSFEIFSKGIDTAQFDPQRSEPPLSRPPYAVGTAASLTPRKGVEDFVEAAIDLLEERPSPSAVGADDGDSAPGRDRERADDERASDARRAGVYDQRATLEFHVAGEPPHDADREYERRLRRRLERTGHADAVTFHGWVDDMPAFYDRLDVFVLPSLNEGVPGAVREALAMELPVIATDVGGTRDVVRDGETGLLIDPEAPDQLAASVRSLLDDPRAGHQMAAAGRELVEREYSVSSYVSNYEAFLREVVES